MQSAPEAFQLQKFHCEVRVVEISEGDRGIDKSNGENKTWINVKD